MKKIVLLLFLCVSLGVYSQDFTKKPVNYVVNLLKENVGPDYLNQKIPLGYEIVLSEPDEVVAEKKVGSRIYDISCYYKEGKLNGIMLSLHSSQIWNLLTDVENAGFTQTKEFAFNGVESYFYDNLDLGYSFLIIFNEAKREITCTLSVKS